VTIARKVRAFTPWPSTFTTLRGETVKVLGARAIDRSSDPAGAPGTICQLPDGIGVVTGNGVLELVTVQRQGRKATSGRSFALGARLAPGSRFDEP
jgi:methionyl-tRNA formyltransferase